MLGDESLLVGGAAGEDESFGLYSDGEEELGVVLEQIGHGLAVNQ